MFLSKGQYLDENSMIRDVFNGGWKKGLNLYALTAAEMIIVVAAFLCMALHDLVYFIARFSTPRGETVCHLVYSIITYATVLIALYYTLSVFGVQTSTILKGAGVVGLIITFGAQNTIADIYYYGVSGADESGITLYFCVFCHPNRYNTVSMTLNEELIAMCQRNGIRLAVSRSLLENGSDTSGSDTSEEKAQSDREKTD